MLGFVKYSKLSMGHEKAQKVDGIFCIHGIYYVYYFYQHTTTREAFVIGFPLAEDIGLILI